MKPEIRHLRLPTKSGKEQRVEPVPMPEFRTKRQIAYAQKLEAAAALQRLQRESEAAGGALVDTGNLAPDGSRDVPEYVSRGYYRDQPFICQDCDKEEIWTATQQKWWYEVAKGGVWTTAKLCRACRRQERERKNQARRIHLEGLERKRSKAKTR